MQMTCLTSIICVAAVTIGLSRVVGGDTIIVGPGGHQTIQQGMRAASDGDEVVVSPGVYNENISYDGKAIAVRSTDGPEVTTIAGVGGSSAVVRCFINEGDEASLEGFTVTNGGIGVDIAQGPTIRNCIIANNPGRGMHTQGTASPLIVDCVFVGNSRENEPGGAVAAFSPAVFMNCVFIENSADDGGVIGLSGSNTVAFINCIFDGNTAMRGGAIHGSATTNFLVVNSEFIGNSAADSGGAVYLTGASTPTFVNCHFDGNSSTFGGGAFHNLAQSSPKLINCTLTTNSAILGAALFSDEFSTPVVINSILWDNDPDAIFDVVALTTVTYSIVEYGWDSPGSHHVLESDPLFVDPDIGDYRLQSTSPAIDAGHNWAIADIAETDLDGNPRFVADPVDFDPGCGIPAVVDMGSYEFQIGDPFPVRLGDIDGDGVVGIVDFLALLADWGACTQTCCLADLDLDSNVGITDFLILLGAWG